MLNDLRLALRGFLRAPGFTAAAVLSLAIGIGANAALFSVVNAVLLKPLPYANADRLAILWNRSPGLNITEDWFSTAQYFDILSGHRGFETLAIALGANYNLTDPGTDPERVGAIRVSSNLLPMLGAAPAMGRLFQAEEDRPGRPPVAILNHGLWQRRYGGDPKIIGRTITLNGISTEVVGVMAERFSLPREVLPTLGVAEDGQVLLPLPLAANAASVRTREDYNIMGVLKPGVRVADAQREMDALTARLRQDHPDVYPPKGGLTFSIVPIREQVAGRIERPLLVLSGAVAFVLLIACVNVANLLLSRALSRAREMAVRAALGAGRARIVRLLFVEGLALAAVGAIVGIALAAAALQWIHAHPPADLPRLGDIALNARVLGFTVIVSLTAAVLFSLAPAFGAGRLDVQTTLKADSRGASGAGALWARGHSLRRVLVGGEIALAVMLLIGAGLLIRSVVSLTRVPTGFDPRGVLTLELTLTAPKYKDGPAVMEGYRRLWERLDAVAGVSASGGITSLPMSGFFAWGPITVEGRVAPAGEKFINADQRTVAGRYFESMGIRLRSGRLFTATDTAAPAPRVVVIDDRMAEELWPGQDPLGKRIKYGDAASDSPWETVVGVVERVKQYGPDADARMAFYRPHTQSPARSLFITVRGPGDPGALAASVSNAVRAFDPDLPLYHVQPMPHRVDASLARQRFAATLLTTFAAIALMLSAIGVYGVMAYQVAQGRREIGIRMALGASPVAILQLIATRGMMIAAIGVAAGLAGAVALSRVMESLVFGISARDPRTFVEVAVALLLVALAAVMIPAVQASRVAATEAIRD